MLQLIRSPYKTDSICPPINLLALAGYVEPYHPVTITDFVLPLIRGELNLDAAGILRMAQIVLDNPAPVLGFTAMCGSYAAALRIAQECRRLDPGRLIVFGGPHAGFVDRETLESFDFVDVIVSGEGEQTLLDLLNAYAAGDSLHHVPGVTFRDGASIIRNPPRNVIDELDSLPFPAYHLIDNVDAYYENSTDRFLEIEAGRGCPFKCKFCSTSLFFSRKYRVKAPEKLIEEMKWLKEHWNISSFGLIHDNLTVNKAKIFDLCDAFLNSGESFTWYCSSRTDTINKEMMVRMKEAGCRGIFFGVETGSQEMQKNIGKRLKLQSAAQTFRDLMEVGIEATGSFIIGFPDEQLSDLEDTLSMAIELRMIGIRDIQFHPLSALPGTDLLDELEETLIFHPHLLSFQDITSVIDITETEMEWIEKHRKIFSNFYAVPPKNYPLDLVYQTRGCYFYLAHYRPRTLYMIKKLAGISNLSLIGMLVEALPAGYENWTEPQLLKSLADVVEKLPEFCRLFIRDILSYETVFTSVVESTDGANGWGRYKGPKPLYDDDEFILKPVRTLNLNYDILSAIHELERLETTLLPEKPHNLAVVFESEESQLRTLEIDDLTSEIIRRCEDGLSFHECLKQFAWENPYLQNEQDRKDWIGQMYQHFLSARLVIAKAV
ncbi:B12-binding domain-containing radical SAM protein [Paenibacillus sp.]|jgi:radical SAM superfamily enzyme YgiQ (UPF0313 family)|uniref:B12-binding domain-containing radical SAM protein n=1 Tax=Paenibacillus sp. TaxID=58172 RepID=UPI00282F7679|nr:radical SAM protein [Paenibacillus sp.]MDR0268159.1 B12-binding domain-containing radical SAM protein [Paenibacillus sp.]